MKKFGRLSQAQGGARQAGEIRRADETRRGEAKRLDKTKRGRIGRWGKTRERRASAIKFHAGLQNFSNGMKFRVGFRHGDFGKIVKFRVEFRRDLMSRRNLV